jgi:hypothetical protein
VMERLLAVLDASPTMVGCVLLGGADVEGECQVESFNLERVGSSVKLVGSSMGEVLEAGNSEE